MTKIQIHPSELATLKSPCCGNYFWFVDGETVTDAPRFNGNEWERILNKLYSKEGVHVACTNTKCHNKFAVFAKTPLQTLAERLNASK